MGREIGYKTPEYVKRKISKSLTGRKRTKEERESIRDGHIGLVKSLETRKKLSKALKGRKLTKEWKRKISKSLKGRPHSEEMKEKIRKYRGELSGSWRGGISKLPYSFDFNHKLKEKIKKRDKYTCQECLKYKSRLKYHLVVHHIDYDKKNSSPSNLVTLCKECHQRTNFKRKDWTKYFRRKMKCKENK